MPGDCSSLGNCTAGSGMRTGRVYDHLGVPSGASLKNVGRVAVPKYTSPSATTGVACTAPILMSEPFAGNRHFSSSFPTVALESADSAALKRHPAGPPL